MLVLLATLVSVSFRKMDKGGQNNTLGRFGGAKGLCTAVLPLGGYGGMPPPRKFLNFRPSEIASGPFFRPFVAFK